MKLVLAHNHYQQAGGEDAVFSREAGLLRRYGHEVLEFVEDNRRIDKLSRLQLGVQTVWSRSSRRRLLQLLETSRPSVVQFHNTFPLISPSAYYACREARVAVVQTLHNYRIGCAAATFVRDGKRCEDCLGSTFAWRGVVHGCYRDDRAATAALVAMTGAHRLLGTWNKTVDLYVALTEFGRRKLIECGLPEDRVVVKPNCLSEDPGEGAHDGGYALFVGRLTDVKGVRTLVEAWERLGGQVPLKIAGSGPLADLSAAATPGIEWLGAVPRERVVQLMQDAAFLVFPSEWYEGFPMTLTEAFATGLPVVGSRLGAMATLIRHGANGLHFEPGNAADLACAVRWAAANPAAMAEMGRVARQDFEQHYTPERNHTMLLDIYAVAIERAAARN